MSKNFLLYSIITATVVMGFVSQGFAEEKATPPDAEFDQILSLDLDDLTVTSVARRAQKLKDSAAAVYVITQEELQRAGINTIPEALRMVPGMQVARVASNKWAISSRGFNGALANKQLVLIDGRSIYTPIFSGTYWDDQSTPIQDIDRIEVIRGPGSSLWGANAVNGIINIITKRADETQGNRVSAAVSLHGRGSFLEGRHGGKISDQTYYRTYVQSLNVGRNVLLTDNSNAGDWYRLRSGFRMDNIDPYSQDSYTLQGDVYGGEQSVKNRLLSPVAPFNSMSTTEDDSYGGNLLGRWSHRIREGSELNLQAYLDHYTRNEAVANQHVSTADIELEHSMTLNDRNNFVWGGGARLYYQELDGTFAARVNDQFDTHNILNVYAQDEYALSLDVLYLTLGSKFEYNDFTGFELQPNARLLWHATDNQTLWAAVSRAVRTPSSIEEDIDLAAQVLPGTPPTELRVFGNPGQQSEELIAYEIGHRIQPRDNLAFDTALFFNDFDNLQTIATPDAPFTGADGNTIIAYRLNNLGGGHVYGAEFTANWNINPDWRLAGSYTFMKMELEVEPGSATTLEAGEELAPEHQFAVRSYYNITQDVHWDNTAYFVDALSNPVDSYLRLDSRLAWLVQPGLEISMIGRNLTDPHHPEFPATPLYETGRSVVGQVLVKF